MISICPVLFPAMVRVAIESEEKRMFRETQLFSLKEGCFSLRFSRDI